MKVGDKVEIETNNHGHKFKLGTIVTVVRKWSIKGNDRGFCKHCDISDLDNVFFQAEDCNSNTYAVGCCEIKKSNITDTILIPTMKLRWIKKGDYDSKGIPSIFNQYQSDSHYELQQWHKYANSDGGEWKTILLEEI